MGGEGKRINATDRQEFESILLLETVRAGGPRRLLSGLKLSAITSATCVHMNVGHAIRPPCRCASPRCGPGAEILAQLKCCEICQVLFPAKLFV